MRSINPAGIALIEQFEGYRDTAYQDSNGIWTLGYGHVRGVKQGDTCTKTQALQWLGEDLASAENAVEHIVVVPLTDNEFSALVSFVFNVGAGKFAGSTLLKKLNAGSYDAVPINLKAWVFAGGKVQQGLVKRRAAEAELWSKPDGS